MLRIGARAWNTVSLLVKSEEDLVNGPYRKVVQDLSFNFSIFFVCKVKGGLNRAPRKLGYLRLERLVIFIFFL